MCLIQAKLTFLVKMHDFLATPLFTETIPQYVKNRLNFPVFQLVKTNSVARCKKAYQMKTSKIDFTLLVKSKVDTLTRCFQNVNTTPNYQDTDHSIKG